MLDDPPLITLRRRFPRPSPEQVEAFRGALTGNVADALGGRGALDLAIKPVLPEQALFVGAALTCHPGPGDNLAVVAAMEIAQPGDVIIAAADGHRGSAVVGDLMLGMMKNKGIAGFVTDGCVRDIPGIRGVGLPCHASGVTPNSPLRNRPGTVGLPIVVGGVTVASGDILVGDLDGVVVVPYAQIDAAIANLVRIRAAEAAVEARIKGGLAVPDMARSLFTSGKVHEVD